MEVTAVEPVLLSHVYPEDVTLEWSAGTIESWDAALVRVETDEGYVGWGEAGHALTGTAAVPGVVDALRDQVVGQDPADVLAIRDAMYDRNLFWARGALPQGVIGAIEIALYDVLGQARGEPVYRLLGGRASSGPNIETYGSGGIAADIDGRVEQAVEIAQRGFDTVKIRAVADPMDNVELVERTIAALEGAATVALDAVQGTAGSPWSVTDAIRLGRALEEHADRIAWYEEPCQAENLTGYRRVRDAVALPVTGIESRTGRYEFRRALEAEAVDVLQPDVTIAGGFDETRRISALAAARDVAQYLHVWGTGVSLLANAHFAVADANTPLIEYCQLPNPLREALLPDDLTRDGPTLTLPDTPGLGLDIPDDLEDRFAFAPGKGHVFH